MCEDDDQIICPATGAYCVRAFCDDYGCANQARVPVDAYDIACGSEDLDETVPRLPGRRRKKKRERRQAELPLSS